MSSSNVDGAGRTGADKYFLSQASRSCFTDLDLMGTRGDAELPSRLIGVPSADGRTIQKDFMMAGDIGKADIPFVFILIDVRCGGL